MEKTPVNRFKRYCERHSFRPVSVLSFLLTIVLVIALLGFFSLQKTGNESKTTSLGLKDIGELATQAGYFTTVQTIYKSRDVLGWEVPDEFLVGYGLDYAERYRNLPCIGVLKPEIYS